MITCSLSEIVKPESYRQRCNGATFHTVTSSQDIPLGDNLFSSITAITTFNVFTQNMLLDLF